MKRRTETHGGATPAPPVGRNPYWGMAGTLVVALLLSHVVCFVVDFLKLLLFSMVSMPPLTQRAVTLLLFALGSAAAAVYIGYQEGYRRRAPLRVGLAGGAIYLPVHALLVWLIPTTVITTGYAADALAEWIYHGKELYVIDTPPRLLVVLCAVAVDAALYVPMTMAGNRWGAWAHREEIRDLKENRDTPRA